MLFVLLLLTVAVVFFYIFYRKYKKSSTVKQYPDTEDFRAAVHESGHAVSAWWCSCVNKITEASIYPTGYNKEKNVIVNGGGHVIYFIYSSTREHFWCNLVISLSGIAAETICYQRFNAKQAESDLMLARKLVGRIIATNDYIFPWKSLEGPSIPFKKIFKDPLSDLEIKIFTQAYLYAKDFISGRRLNHNRLVLAFQKNKTIKEQELIKLFGNRTFIRVIDLFSSTFVRP